MKKRNKIALGVFAIFYIVFGAHISLNQEKIIYLPQPGLSFANCSAPLEAERVTHNGTRMFVRDTGLPTVVFYHGNADSVCNLNFFANFITSNDYDYILVEYGGYSKDPQQPSHEVVKQDVRNVADYLITQNATNTVFMGQSIGAGAASYHTFLQPPQKLILISPFTDLLDIANGRFWFYPTSLLVDNAFDNVSALQNYRGKVLIIHGDKDITIPYKLGRYLYDSLETDKELVTLPDANHNNVFGYQETFLAISELLQEEID